MAVGVSAREIFVASWRRSLVIGHRGAADEAPENTLAAFEAGIASGASAIECDVHLSADGEVVVIHDATLDRTTSLKGRVSETAWETMRAVGVPSFTEVVRLAKGRCVLVVEIKAGEGVEERVVDLVRQEGTIQETIVFAFESERIQRIKRLAPEILAVRLLSIKEALRGRKAVLERMREIDADGVGMDYRCAIRKLVTAIQAAGLPVFVWAVPLGRPIERLRSRGINFVITNDPRAVRAQLQP